MVTESEPKKIILYCDKVSGKCLVRVVDDRFDTVLQYGTLPPLCSISDLYIDVIKITKVDIFNSNYIIYNSKYHFKLENGIVNVFDAIGNSTSSVNDSNEFLRRLFNINFV